MTHCLSGSLTTIGNALTAHSKVKHQWILYVNALNKHHFGRMFTLTTKLKMNAFSYRIISVIFTYEKRNDVYESHT